MAEISKFEKSMSWWGLGGTSIGILLLCLLIGCTGYDERGTITLSPLERVTGARGQEVGPSCLVGVKVLNEGSVGLRSIEFRLRASGVSSSSVGVTELAPRASGTATVKFAGVRCEVLASQMDVKVDRCVQVGLVDCTSIVRFSR